MFESLGLDITPRAASVWLGLLLGALFGALALLTRFCLRRALVGPLTERAEARGVWALALAVALLGTQAAVAAGWIGFDAHRFHAPTLPVLAIVLGGLMFGAGAVLARGCISRLTVLSVTGNLRAAIALLVFAVAAHATMQGVFAPLRLSLAEVTVAPGVVSLGALPGGVWVWKAALSVAALAVVLRSRAGWATLAGAAALGALVPLGWIGTGFVLFDDFDPIEMESLAFTGPWAETLFWGIAASLTQPSFGLGLIGGVLAGALAAALASRQVAWQGFDSPGQIGRTVSGAGLMGVGGVLAGGCTVGAGLAGVPSLSIAALLALAAIAGGMIATNALLSRRRAAPLGVPAE